MLTDIEKQTIYEHEPSSYLDTKSEGREVSRYLVPANATACSHWRCHLDTLDWKDRLRLGFAHGFEGYFSLKKYLNQEEYAKANADNPFS